MKSHINILADYHKAPVKKEVVISCSEDYIEKKIRCITRKHKKNQQADTVEKGDVVLLSLESELEKFNKKLVPVTVGGGLFDEELEKSLSGRNAGEIYTTYVAEKPVIITVKQITRSIYPEATDDMVEEYVAEHDDLEGIHTVDEYRQAVIDEYIENQKQQILYEATDEIIGYVLSHTDGTFDDDEVRALAEQDKAYIDEELKAEEKTLDSLTPEEYSVYFGVSSVEELEEMLYEENIQRIGMALWIGAVNGVDTADKTIEELEDLGLDFLDEYVKQTVEIKVK
jgi:oligoribonuclease (3'-5' exoribonuclease)